MVIKANYSEGKKWGDRSPPLLPCLFHAVAKKHEAILKKIKGYEDYSILSPFISCCELTVDLVFDWKHDLVTVE